MCGWVWFVGEEKKAWVSSKWKHVKCSQFSPISFGTTTLCCFLAAHYTISFLFSLNEKWWWWGKDEREANGCWRCSTRQSALFFFSLLCFESWMMMHLSALRSLLLLIKNLMKRINFLKIYRHAGCTFACIKIMMTTTTRRWWCS